MIKEVKMAQTYEALPFLVGGEKALLTYIEHLPTTALSVVHVHSHVSSGRSITYLLFFPPFHSSTTEAQRV